MEEIRQLTQTRENEAQGLERLRGDMRQERARHEAHAAAQLAFIARAAEALGVPIPAAAAAAATAAASEGATQVTQGAAASE